jgi:predicted dehydrogenase
MIRVGICGFGYWGPNLYRNFALHRGFDVTAIADMNKTRQAHAQSLNSNLRVYDDAIEMIDSGDVDAVIIATPVATHYRIAAHALRKGKHVLVEKPLCERVTEAEELVELAARGNLSLLVDHVYLFHEAVRMLKDFMTSGKLGQVSYFDSLRVNLGLFQPDVNVLWDLAPHDFSIMDYLLDEEPAFIEATGYYHINPKLPDIVYVTAHYRSRMIAHINLSWMSPVKVRRIAIGGSNQMVVWDDLNNEERLKVYNSGIELRPEEQRHVHYRIGDIYSPRVPNREALTGVVAEFHRTITGDKSSVIDGRRSVRIVRMLEAAQTALDRNLSIVESSMKASVALGAAPARRTA